MSNARNLANIITGNYDIPAGALDNAVPADGSITAAKLASTLNLTGKTVTLPSGTGGKVVGVHQKILTAASAVNLSVGVGYQYPNFDVTFTPVSHQNYFLLMPSLSVSMTTQGNAGIGLTENSTGAQQYIVDTTGTQIKNPDYASIGISGMQDMIIWIGFAAHSGNSEDQRTYSASYLTRLRNQSASGAVTWSMYIIMGETPPLYLNRQASINTGSWWSGPSTSSYTVLEIAA